MATLKQRLHRKNGSGGYDIVHLETSASCVLMDSGATLESKISEMDTTIAGKVSSSHNHAATDITSGTLPVARGGTGVTANPSMLTNLASTTAAGVFAASPRPGVTGTLPVANGGTGKASWTANRLMYPSAATTMNQLAFPTTAGSVLRQGTSGAPYWTSLADLKTALGITDTSTPSTGSSVAVGGTISFGDYDWICVHSANGIKYMMTKYVIGATVFGNTNVFASSQALLFCRLLEAAFGLSGNSDFTEFTNDGVTGKLLLATYAQCNGGFSYFSSNANRIGTDVNGTATTWWTSSPYGGNVCCVSTSGDLYDSNPSYALGFRPCVALKV